MKKEKTNSGLIVLVLILAIVIICLGAFIFLDKTKNNTNTDETQEKNTTKIQTTSKKEIINNMSVDEQYKAYLNNLKRNVQKELEKDSEISLSTDSMYIDGGFSFRINKDLDLYMSLSDSKYKTKYKDYKIDSNVLTMSVIYTGNGGFKSLYYITLDGKVKNVCLDCIQSEELTIKEEKHKNIIDIVQGNYNVSTSTASKPIFIDINGSIITD